VAYCSINDVSIGNIPLPTYIDKQNFVDDASDEIDSKIGFLYTTPIDIADSGTNPVVRPARLLLKRIATSLATGRLILALDAAGEDQKLHSYGWSLVREATAALNKIADGEIPLEGATLVDPAANTAKTVLLYNEDAESSVEAFYNRISNPAYAFPTIYGTYITGESGLVR
jgi:hypothetical protein